MQEKEKQSAKRIKQISVKNLFGLFNHVIPLNMDERLTIIHSPNGFGKTMLLKLLKELFSQETFLLATTPFEELRADFDDATSFWLTKGPQEPHIINEDNTPTIVQIAFNSTHENSYLYEFDRNNHFYTYSSVLGMINADDDDVFTTLQKKYHYPPLSNIRQLIGRGKGDSEPQKEPDWLTLMRETIVVRFIETQRLLYLRRNRQTPDKDGIGHSAIPTVRMYAEELAKNVKAKLAESASLAQSLDRTFPERVFNPATNLKTIDEAGLRHHLNGLEQKRRQLMSAGLLDQEESTAFQLDASVDESKKIMLSVYIEDNEKKLNVFNDLEKKINLLTEVINNRFLYKKMTIDKEQGFVFTSSNGTNLLLDNLSSGEQHELVLFYELLFHVAPGSLILVDEPEISLHIVWQEQFLKDLQAVTRITNTDVIVATHSPDIIADRRDLVVELRGPDNGHLQ